MISVGANYGTKVIRYPSAVAATVTGTGQDTRDFTGELTFRLVCPAATAADNDLKITIKQSATSTGPWSNIANPTTTAASLVFSTVTSAANVEGTIRLDKNLLDYRYVTASLSITTTTGDNFYPMVEMLGYKTYTT